MLTGPARVPHGPRRSARSRPGDPGRRVPPGHEQQARPRRHDLLGLRRPPRGVARGRGRARGADHRLPLLTRGDGVARVRGPVSPSRTRGSTSRTTDDVDVLLADMGFRPRDTPVVITPTGVLRHPTPGEFAEHLGLTFQPGAGIHVRPGGRRKRSGRPGRRGVRRVGGSQHRVARRGVRPAGRPAPARASRTTSGSRTGSPAKSSRHVPRSRRNGSAPV